MSDSDNKPWHPELPTSDKARRMLYKPCDEALALSTATRATILITVRDVDADARFIIGTIAARLCEQMGNGWFGTASRWRKWAGGEAWQ